MSSLDYHSLIFFLRILRLISTLLVQICSQEGRLFVCSKSVCWVDVLLLGRSSPVFFCAIMLWKFISSTMCCCSFSNLDFCFCFCLLTCSDECLLTRGRCTSLPLLLIASPILHLQCVHLGCILGG